MFTSEKKSGQMFHGGYFTFWENDHGHRETIYHDKILLVEDSDEDTVSTVAFERQCVIYGGTSLAGYVGY
jgi:hypothetical protein